MKSKKIKRLFAAMLASAMCLTACANNETKSPVGDSEEQKDSSATVSEESQTSETKMYWEMLDEVSDTSELPDWTGEKLEINYWCAGGTDTMFGTVSETNVTLKEIERVTGVTFNVDDCFSNGGDNIDAKMPKVVASGDFPTIVYGWDIDKQLQALWENGYLADLTEYYENGYLNNVLEWLPIEEMDSLIYSRMRDENGSYYKIPDVDVASYYQDTGYAPEAYDSVYYQTYSGIPSNEGNIIYNYAVYVRDDILQALYPDAYTTEDLQQIYVESGTFTEEQIYDLGLNTTEDFFGFLRDIQTVLKDHEFKGMDGSAVEVTYGPHTGTDNWGWMNFLPHIAAGFPDSDYFAVAERNREEGELLLKWAIDAEPTVDWMKGLNQLVNEDIISKNSLVDNQATFDEKFLNGHYAVLYGVNPNNIDGSSEGWAYRPVWVNCAFDEDYYGFSGMPTMSSYAIFKDAVPEGQMDQLIHFIDYMNSEVGIKNIYWGPKSAGLFTEDSDGNRTYTNAELENCMIYGEDTKSAWEYGLYNERVSEQPFSNFPLCGGEKFLEPKYLAAGSMERDAKDMIKYYNPGILAGKSFKENSIKVASNNQIYGLGISVEGIAQFWTARAGYENQMKKVIVAASEAEFETQLEILCQYAEDNGLTDETLQEYNDLFIEKNREALERAGLVE